MSEATQEARMKINEGSLRTIWYENEAGERRYPDLEGDLSGQAERMFEEGFAYQIGRFPNEVTERCLLSKDVDGGRVSTEVYEANSTWSEDEVMAIRGLGFGLHDAILISTTACARCREVIDAIIDDDPFRSIAAPPCECGMEARG